MAISVGADVTTSEIIDAFQSAVVANILSSDLYHSGNIPFYKGYQCVPGNIMDHKNNVNTTPNVGSVKNIVNADVILQGLIDIVRNLTRVGTFTFTLNQTHSNTASYPSEWTESLGSMSGKVLFTSAYIRTYFGNPTNVAGTEYGKVILASNLNELMTNIYDHWYNFDRHKYIEAKTICHVSCHYNCHSNCHDNCHGECHGWTVIKNDM